jgi:hypothetical protein
MGSKTITVDDQELIRVENISFNLLTNIDIQTNLIEHIDPISKIHFRIKPIFNRLDIENKNQVNEKKTKSLFILKKFDSFSSVKSILF